MYIRHILTIILSALCCSVSAQSAYISRVYEYRPAPGQFVNTLPSWEEGDNDSTMAAKAQECLVGEEGSLVSLGAWGGYVTFGFDHKVENRPGKFDLKILGNAFFADANPNPTASKRGGSSEPGIVLVSEDTNGNGLPDDPWYEIAGSEYYKPETKHGYRLVYTRPDSSHVATPNKGYAFLTDTTYIAWADNYGDRGYVSKNSFHSQNYYPNWIAEDSMVFEGSRLADNYVDESGKGTYYVQYCYGRGYVDNVPNADSLNLINLEWAVDSDGMPVELSGIDFVRVYTGVNQYCGWLGETSTEICGAIDLHITGEDTDDFTTTAIAAPTTESVASGRVEVYSLQGQRVATPISGQIYIVRKGGTTRKTVWR